MWQFNSVAIVYFFSFLLSLYLAIKSFTLKPGKRTFYFACTTFFTSIWSLGYLLGFFSTSLDWKLFIIKFEILGTSGAVYFWILFILTYVGYEKYISKKLLLILAIIPLSVVVMVFTIEYHSFYYHRYFLEKSANLIIFKKIYGPGFYINVINSYSMLLAGGILLLNYINSIPDKYKSQIYYIFLFLLILYVPNFLYIINKNPIAPYDPTPISFGIGVLIFSRLERKYRFIKIVPHAHKKLFNKVPSAIIILDENLNIIESNEKANHLFNLYFTRSVNIGSVLPELKQKIQTDRKYDQTIEFCYTEKKMIFDLQISPMINDEEIEGYVLLFNNITSIKNTMVELETYAHTVAHDLKNPIGVIRGFAELLLDNDSPLEERTQFIEFIHQNSLKLGNIVDSLLKLSYIRKQSDIELVKLNMNEIVEHSLSRIQNMIDERNAEIIFQKNLPSIYGDEIWIEEVWTNYLSNAVKYGGNPPVIEIGFENKKDTIKYFIKDNGKGVSDEDRQKLFNEYSRLEMHKENIKGHGLGLSIVKRIIEKLNGHVSIESELGKGSVFSFELPKNKD